MRLTPQLLTCQQCLQVCQQTPQTQVMSSSQQALSQQVVLHWALPAHYPVVTSHTSMHPSTPAQHDIHQSMTLSTDNTQAQATAHPFHRPQKHQPIFEAPNSPDPRHLRHIVPCRLPLPPPGKARQRVLRFDLREQRDFAADVLERVREDPNDLGVEALLARVRRVQGREGDAREEVPEEARVGVRGVEAVLREVEGEEGWGEDAGAGGGEEGVLGRGGVGARGGERGEVRCQWDGHFAVC